MSIISLAEALEQDIRALEGILCNEKYGLTKKNAQIMAKRIIANLKQNIEELIESF